MTPRNSLMILIALCLPAVPALAEGYPTDGQLLTNPGFDIDANEDGVPDGWNADTGRTLLREKVFMGGDRELVSVGESYVLATQDVALEPGETYTIAFSARGEDGATAGALLLHGKDAPTREMPVLWRVPVETDYLTYMVSFEAPNPVARLYLYNCAKTGHVSYDWVSLVKGKPDRAYIRQFGFGERDTPIEEPVVTEHRPWGIPLAGGPIKSLVSLYQFRTVRELVELSQRVELDYDVLEGGYTGTSLTAENGHRMMQRLADREYEVYVIASRLDERLDKDIKRNVEEGAGLVVLSGFARLSRYCDVESLQVADRSHPLLAAIPWDHMPAHILNEVRVGALGEGRVVWLNFPTDVSRVWGVWPVENSHEAYMSREMRYWEYWLALIGRSIQWAARGESGIEVSPADGDTPTLRIVGAPAGATVDITSRFERELRWGDPDLVCATQTSPVGDGLVAVELLHELRGGATLIDVTVRDAEGGALWWGCPLRIEREQEATITTITQPQDSWEPGDTVTAPVTCEGDPAGLTLDARLVDAYGRLVAEESVPAAAEATVELTPPAKQILCVGHKLFVTLMDEAHEVDSAWTDVYFPRRGYEDAARNFHISAWGDGFTNPVVSQQYSKMLLELGLNGKFGSWTYATSETGLVPGLHAHAGHVFWAGKPPGGGVRNPCLSDPATIEKYTTDAREEVADLGRFGLFAINIQDEATLASRHDRYEVCFSDFCQARYREWLADRYGDIGALNAEWETDYGSFAEVSGARTEDVRGSGNFAPFVDFRTFMTDVWVDGMSRIVKAYHSGLPTACVGHTNTFGSCVTNGADYYKLCTQCGFGWAQEYSEAIKGTAQKAVFELWRSFSPKDFPNYGWIGYEHRHAAVTYEPWWLALHGSRGVTYFATNACAAERNKSWALVYPTQAFTPYSLEVKDTLTDLREGVGKLLMEYDREDPEIALLWSHPSMFTAWCESETTEPIPREQAVDDAYGSYFKSAFYFRLALSELQLTCNYVAPPQIATGELSKYRVLFLPFTLAISDETADAIMEWVEAGGTLIADMRLARTDEHGKWRDNEMIERLVGVARTTTDATYELTPVTAGEGVGFDSSGREAIEVIGDAHAVGQHADGTPALVVRDVGQGRTVYLNCLLPKYEPGAVEMIRALLEEAGIARDITVTSTDPEVPARAWECNLFSRSGIRVVGLIRDHRLTDEAQTCTVDFGREANVFDLRARQSLGHTRTIESTCAPGEAKIYALLPYAVTGVNLTLGADASFEVALIADGPIGDHVLQLTWTDPRGDAPRHYESVVAAPDGKYTGHVPLAANDLRGQWTLTVRDALTNVTAQASVAWPGV